MMAIPHGLNFRSSLCLLSDWYTSNTADLGLLKEKILAKGRRVQCAVCFTSCDYNANATASTIGVGGSRLPLNHIKPTPCFVVVAYPVTTD